MNFNVRIICLYFLISLPFISLAQDKEMLESADRLHLTYRFQEAAIIYDTLLKHFPDSISRIPIEEKMIQCENGMNLMKYATTPKVISKSSCPIADFYLYFPQFGDKSWTPIPNPVVPKGMHPYYSAVYFPENATKIFFSAPDNSGSWNIYEISHIEGYKWSEPKMLNELVSSSNDEIFPMISSDGKELYFASNGHFGMGGYDLFVSRWDESTEDWGVPENLGFPYSSTSDDIFFANTPDGLFSIIASTRNSENGNIGVFAVEYISTPIKKSLDDITEIQSIAALNIAPKPQEGNSVKREESKEDNQMNQYSLLVAQMRDLQNKLKAVLDKQQESRELYEKQTNEGNKQFFAEIIAEKEKEEIEIRAKLDIAVANVQEAEMNFLEKGIIPQLEDPTPQNEFKDSLPDYKFVKSSFSEIRNMEVEKPQPKFDYSFKISDKAIIAEDNTLPDGIVYQIQLFVVSNRTSLKSLKGLSPVFEKKQSSGKYLYTVGLFPSHTEALSCLNKVRKSGFPKAFIVAFNNGNPTSIRTARAMEKRVSANDSNSSYQILIKNYPDGLPSPILEAIRANTDKDIAKTTSNDVTIYIIGPFSSKKETEQLSNVLSGMGISENISVEPINLQ